MTAEYSEFDNVASDIALISSTLEKVLEDEEVTAREIAELKRLLPVVRDLKERTAGTGELMRCVVRLIRRSRLDRNSMRELHRYAQAYPGELDKKREREATTTPDDIELTVAAQAVGVGRGVRTEKHFTRPTNNDAPRYVHANNGRGRHD